jgi:selenoprotein W-related protein
VPATPRLEIHYCTQCRWLLRAAWTAQELLTTFPADLGEVALVPGTGGVFRVLLDGEPLWDRADGAGFPELPELKRRVRDRIAPERPLGHTDRAGTAGTGGPDQAGATS